MNEHKFFCIEWHESVTFILVNDASEKSLSLYTLLQDEEVKESEGQATTWKRASVHRISAIRMTAKSLSVASLVFSYVWWKVVQPFLGSSALKTFKGILSIIASKNFSLSKHIQFRRHHTPGSDNYQQKSVPFFQFEWHTKKSQGVFLKQNKLVFW